MVKCFISILLFFVVNAAIGQEAKGTISGVVTYYYNQYQGDKPDVGAKVYITRMGLFADSTIGKITKYILARSKGGSIDREVDNNAFRAFAEIRLDDSTVTRTVDGSGNYSAKLPPGNYIVFLQSKGRKTINLTEVGGKLSVKYITVAADDVQDVSYNFDIY